MNLRTVFLALILLGSGFAVAGTGYIEMALISPERGNLTFSPGQVAVFVVQVIDGQGMMVDDAIIEADVAYSSNTIGNGIYGLRYQIENTTRQQIAMGMGARRGNQTARVSLALQISRALLAEFITPSENQNLTESGPVEVNILYPNGNTVMAGDFTMVIGNKSFALNRLEDAYIGFLNLSGESYGAKNISFFGKDDYGNRLDRTMVINYIENKDYTVYLVGLLVIAGGFGLSYFVYDWGSRIKKDYSALKKESAYLKVMDKRTHLEFLKRHIGESMFKKLALEYQQKLKDIDSIMVELEKMHRWLKWF